MNFELSEEQVQLQDSVGRLLADSYTFEQRRAIAASAEGWSPAVWRQLCELGLAGLCIDEAAGGFGGRAADLGPVLQTFGRALLLEPFMASAVLGATALQQAADASTRERLLPKVASGETILAWADDEPAARHAPLWVETKAVRDGERWRLHGLKSNVQHAAAADALVVVARSAGAPAERDGLGLFLVERGAAGLQRRDFRLVDDTPAAELTFEGVEATPLGDPTQGWNAIEAVRAAGIAALCADAVGAMEGAYALTMEYLRTRKQFGRLLGENQALRHRAAEMLVSLEVARSMAGLAAAVLDDPATVEPGDLLRAKLIIGRHGRSLCQSAIQLHGGIGMTEEYAVGHYLRRLLVIDQTFGDAASQAARLADLLEARHG